MAVSDRIIPGVNCTVQILTKTDGKQEEIFKIQFYDKMPVLVHISKDDPVTIRIYPNPDTIQADCPLLVHTGWINKVA